MNVAIKILFSLLVAAVLSSVNASGQTTASGSATRQVKADTARNGQWGSEMQARSAPQQTGKTSPPGEQPEREEKKWGLQVVTGEKWYQVSIKLVM